MFPASEVSPFMISLKVLEDLNRSLAEENKALTASIRALSEKKRALQPEILANLADMALSLFPDDPSKAKELYLSKARKKEIFSEQAILSVWDSVFSAFDPDAISQ